MLCGCVASQMPSQWPRLQFTMRAELSNGEGAEARASAKRNAEQKAAAALLKQIGAA